METLGFIAEVITGAFIMAVGFAFGQAAVSRRK